MEDIFAIDFPTLSPVFQPPLLSLMTMSASKSSMSLSESPHSSSPSLPLPSSCLSKEGLAPQPTRTVVYMSPTLNSKSFLKLAKRTVISLPSPLTTSDKGNLLFAVRVRMQSPPFIIFTSESTGLSFSKLSFMSLILTTQFSQSPLEPSLTEALILATHGRRYLTLRGFMVGADLSKSAVRLKVRPLSTRVPPTSVKTEPTGAP
mmetsp:Transcript_6933/g.14413  ORF Transcript_6933/g.14413 Transcript_6933/m.14413 type:complete len:204 (-) Transcript_6933:248-859(-)